MNDFPSRKNCMLKHKSFAALLIGLVVLCVTQNLYAGNAEIKIRASAGQKYDDNINFGTQGNKLADFVSTLSTGMSLSYETQRTLTQVIANVTQELYWKYTENQNTAEDLTFSLKQALTKHDNILMSDSFTHTYEPQTFDEEFARVGGRFSYFRNRFDIGYLRDFSEQFTTKIGYGNDLDISNNADLLDSYVNRASVEGRYALSSKRSVFATYDFLHRELDPRGGQANINTLSGGLREYFTEQLSLEGRVGIDIVDSYNDKRYYKPLYTATLTDQLNERTAANLSFTQRYSTNPYTSDVFNSWRISGALNSQLNSRLSTTASIFYGRGEYISLNIEDNLIGGNIGFSYDLNKYLKANVSYTYSETTSNVSSREYRKNVVFLGMTTEF